jgi:hypothetical protein
MKEPTQSERNRLQNKLQKEVDKVHGKDEDSDHYARVQVQDRRDGRWPFIRPVPRIPWDNPTTEQFQAALEAATNNVESTSRDMETIRRDMMAYFEHDSRMRSIRQLAKKILGEKAIVGRAYDRSDDASSWCQWVPYRTMRAYNEAEKPTLQTCFYDATMFDLNEFKKWLVAGKRTLTKEHGKYIKGWYIRLDGSCGTSLSASVETPEVDRPAIIARNRAKREFLEAHATEIEHNATVIEVELRTKANRK